MAGEYKDAGEARKRVPRTAPDAPRVRRGAIWEPWVRPPAARRGVLEEGEGRAERAERVEVRRD